MLHHLALKLVLAAFALRWMPEPGNVTVGLRGLSVVSERVVWASGNHGTFLRTRDGGQTWEVHKIAGLEALDFRDVVAFDSQSALLMSSGNGDASRLYRTQDGGANLRLVLQNTDKAGFFDAVKFWDRQHGILLGDPVQGHFTVFITEDGGEHWSKATQPAALPEEGAFAASGTSLTLFGQREAWFGSGGAGGGRVFHSSDRGGHWTVARTPLSGRVASAGIFSLRFLDRKNGVAIGGDYQSPDQTKDTSAVTQSSGLTWQTSLSVPHGFRSAVAYVKNKKLLIAVGTNGSDFSKDGGLNWTPLSNDRLNAVAAHQNHVWAVGPNGVILKLAFTP